MRLLSLRPVVAAAAAVAAAAVAAAAVAAAAAAGLRWRLLGCLGREKTQDIKIVFVFLLHLC